MSDHTPQGQYERVVALRQATFELLQQHTHRPGHLPDPHVTTCLQDAANRLGAAEQSLKQLVGG